MFQSLSSSKDICYVLQCSFPNCQLSLFFNPTILLRYVDAYLFTHFTYRYFICYFPDVAGCLTQPSFDYQSSSIFLLQLFQTLGLEVYLKSLPLSILEGRGRQGRFSFFLSLFLNSMSKLNSITIMSSP